MIRQNAPFSDLTTSSNDESYYAQREKAEQRRIKDQKWNASKDIGKGIESTALMGAAFLTSTDEFGMNPFTSDDSLTVPQTEELRSKSALQISSNSPAYDSGPINENTWGEFVDHLAVREGIRNDVYEDSRGLLTVGVGHLVRPEDGLSLGDTISDDQIHEFLQDDARSAYRAAIRQAQELGVTDAGLIKGLASVNYQLGNNWTTEHKDTWELMKQGNFAEAAIEAQDSDWADQTPVRVQDLQAALIGASYSTNDGIDMDTAANEPNFFQKFVLGA